MINDDCVVIRDARWFIYNRYEITRKKLYYNKI